MGNILLQVEEMSKRGRPSKGDTALTGAERSKRYRLNHSAEYKEYDALRKRAKRAQLKLNPVADAARKKEEATAKRVLRAKKKSEG